MLHFYEISARDYPGSEERLRFIDSCGHKE
jgi:hypothetical protein